MKARRSNRALQSILREVELVAFDFDGVFTDNRVTVSEDGKESIVCCRSDGLGLKRLRAVGVDAMIITTETNKVASVRAGKLAIACFYGVEDKLTVLKKEAAKRRIGLDKVAFVGNDINDAECLKAVGLPVVVADAWEEVIPHARLVLKRRGGDGAVREFCDMIWVSHGQTV